MSPKVMSESSLLVPVSVTLTGKRISADIIRGLETRPSWVRMGPTSNDKCPYKRKDMETHTQRRPYEGGDRDEICSSKPRGTEDCQGSPDARREAWDRCFPRSIRRNQPYQHVRFGILGPRTQERLHLCYLKPPSLCRVLWQPQEAQTS